MTSLPIHHCGLAIPCIETELMTMDATAVGQWAASVSQRELLIEDVLWGSEDGPTYITSCWIVEVQPQIQSILWETEAIVLSLSAAHHIRHGDVPTVRRRASCYSSTANTVYNDDGSVTINFH